MTRNTPTGASLGVFPHASDAQAPPPGKHTIVFEFKYDGGGIGKGGMGARPRGGYRHAGDARLRRAVPFTGKIEKVTIDLE